MDEKKFYVWIQNAANFSRFFTVNDDPEWDEMTQNMRKHIDCRIIEQLPENELEIMQYVKGNMAYGSSVADFLQMIDKMVSCFWGQEMIFLSLFNRLLQQKSVQLGSCVLMLNRPEFMSFWRFEKEKPEKIALISEIVEALVRRTKNGELAFDARIPDLFINLGKVLKSYYPIVWENLRLEMKNLLAKWGDSSRSYAATSYHDTRRNWGLFDSVYKENLLLVYELT